MSLTILKFIAEGESYDMNVETINSGAANWIHALILAPDGQRVAQMVKHFRCDVAGTAVTFTKLVNNVPVAAALPTGWRYLLEAL